MVTEVEEVYHVGGVICVKGDLLYDGGIFAGVVFVQIDVSDVVGRGVGHIYKSW